MTDSRFKALLRCYRISLRRKNLKLSKAISGHLIAKIRQDGSLIKMVITEF